METLLGAAQKCYVQADLGCAVRLLEPESALPADAPLADRAERLRLLAFAASRLDRHELARKAFASWIRLSDQHRLDRASTPGGIYADYTAAWIECLGAGLDRQPILDHRPVLVPPRPEPADLPRFAPPPRSARDNANNFAFFVGLGGAAEPGQPAGSLSHHLGVQLGLNLGLSERWRAGLNLQVLRWSWESAGQAAGVSRVLSQLQGAWALWQPSAHRLEVVLDGGMAFDWTGDTIGALGGGLRYHPVGLSKPALWYVEVLDQLGLRSRIDHILSISFGLVLQPARPQPGPAAGP